MTNTENTALQMIAEAARCPDYGPDMVKALMEKLDMNEKDFALLMNVAPSTVRLWTSGAAQPSGTARRLMQIYETGPEIVGKIAGGQPPADGGNRIRNFHWKFWLFSMYFMKNIGCFCSAFLFCLFFVSRLCPD